MAGIADVAREAGVSKSTASRALTGAGYVSIATRDRVRAAADALGYSASTHAVSLVTGRTRSVGVIMPYVNRWFFAEVLEGIQQALLSRGLDLVLYDAKPGSSGRARIFDDFLGRKRFDGLIAVGLEPDSGEIASIRRTGKPIVGVVSADDDTSVIAVDDRYAARRATEHLLALGHENITFLGGGQGGEWAHVDHTRYRGYEEAMRSAGHGERMRHVASAVHLPGGYAAAVDVLSDTRSRPTAIVGVCDEVAIGAIIAARRLGVLVPTDVSVIGIDDHEYAEMFSLTTLRQVPREQGIAAVERLLALIDDPDAAPERTQMQATLVVRNSTGARDARRAAAVLDARLSP